MKRQNVTSPTTSEDLRVFSGALNPMAQQKLIWDIIPLVERPRTFAIPHLELPSQTPQGQQAQKAVRERLSMSYDAINKRFRFPSQTNIVIAGEGLIYFVSGGDFNLKSLVRIDAWR